MPPRPVSTTGPAAHSFGRVLRQRRQDLGLTLEALAELVPCSVQHRSESERGVRYASLPLLVRIDWALSGVGALAGWVAALVVEQLGLHQPVYAASRGWEPAEPARNTRGEERDPAAIAARVDELLAHLRRSAGIAAAQEGAGAPAPAQPPGAAPPAGGPPVPPVVAGTDELVVPVRPGVRTISLHLCATDGASAEPRHRVALPGWSPAPGALVGLGEGWIEIAVGGTMGQARRPEHGVKITDRRTFLSLGVALPLAVTADHLDRLRDTLTTCRVDALAVEGLERIGAGLRRAWNHVPAPELLPAVRWQIRFLRELRPASPALRPRLVTLVGSMEALAGWMVLLDLHDSSGAEDHLRTALTAAQEAANPELAALGLLHLAAPRTARLTSAHGNGPSIEAVQMVEEAQHLATTSGSPTTEAFVAAEASAIHACDGDEPASRRSIERAEAALSRIEACDPFWIGPGRFGALWLRADEAANLMHLGKPEAVKAFRSLLEQYVAERRQTRVYPLTNLARALVQQGEIVEGARYADEALSLAAELGSGVNLRRIRTLYAEDLRVHRDHPDVRALGDRLAEM